MTLVPFSRPASGDVLVPIVIEIAGWSTVISGSATGFSGSASVSPIVMSGMPAMATMSPGPALSPGTRSSSLVTSSSVILTFSTVPSRFIHATWEPFLRVPSLTRTSARRPRNGEASRLVTWACSGAPSVYSGAGTASMIVWNSGIRFSLSGSAAVLGLVQRGAAGAGGGVDDGEVEGVLAGTVLEQVEEQLVRLVDDLGDARVGTVDLVDDQDDGHLGGERLAQHEAGLGQRALGRVDQQDDGVDHRQAALDLATEVGVAGGVDDVDRDAALGGAGAVVADRGVLREDRDALLALEVAGVHGALGELVVLVEVALLLEHGVDERGLAVVDVGDDCDVAQVGANGHAKNVLSVGNAHDDGAFPFYGCDPRADESRDPASLRRDKHFI